MARAILDGSGAGAAGSGVTWRARAARLAGTLWFRTTLALLGVYVAIVPLGLVVAAQQEQATAAARRATGVARADSDVRDLETSLLQERAALHDLDRTDYDVARTAAAGAWSALERDARGTAVEGRLPELARALDAWHAWAGERRAGTVGGAPGDGDGLLTGFEAAASRFESAAAESSVREGAEADRLLAGGVAVGTVAPLLGATAMLSVGSFLLWLSVRPVRRLAQAANRLAGGLDPEIPYTQRRDEVGAVARALAGWRRAAASQRLVWQHSPVAMLFFGADLTILQVNPTLLVMFGADPARFNDREYMATMVSNVTHPDDVAATSRMYRRLMSGRSETEVLDKRYIRSDGSVFWGTCILTLVRDAAGKPERYVCMIVDISERRERLERAARVQRDMLPEPALDLEGYELAGVCRSSREMGGDFYDWARRGRDELTLTLGDVMGKDMPAALLMATVCVALRTSATLPTVGEAVRSVAASTERDLDRAGAFVTLFHARLDLETGVLTYVDAGHGLAVVMGESGVRRLTGDGSLPLGVEVGEPYEERGARLAPGETLVVFSDGVLDVHPALETRLEAVDEVLDGTATAREMAERLASGPGTAQDDVTVVVLRRSPWGD